jgi:hypothetical protein
VTVEEHLYGYIKIRSNLELSQPRKTPNKVVLQVVPNQKSRTANQTFVNADILEFHHNFQKKNKKIKKPILAKIIRHCTKTQMLFYARFDRKSPNIGRNKTQYNQS